MQQWRLVSSEGRILARSWEEARCSGGEHHAKCHSQTAMMPVRARRRAGALSQTAVLKVRAPYTGVCSASGRRDSDHDGESERPRWEDHVAPVGTTGFCVASPSFSRTVARGRVPCPAPGRRPRLVRRQRRPRLCGRWGSYSTLHAENSTRTIWRAVEEGRAARRMVRAPRRAQNAASFVHALGEMPGSSQPRKCKRRFAVSV